MSKYTIAYYSLRINAPKRLEIMRRAESTGVQLHRMGYKPAGDSCCSFDYLENDNQRAIYCNALHAFGLTLDTKDETHASIIEFIRGQK